MSSTHTDKQINYIEFPVSTPSDLARTREFFSQVFGWEYQMWGDAYADTQSSGTASGIGVEKDEVSHPPLPVVYVTDLEATLHQVQEAGAQIVKPIFSFPGGRRFHFREPSGHEIAAWTDQPGTDADPN